MSDAKSPRGRKTGRGTLGNLESLGLPEIIQSLTLGRRTARLSMTSSGRWGHIWLEEGVATHAQTHTLTGELAFFEMVGWKTGQFLLEPEVHTDARSLDHDPMFLIMEGSRRLDESVDGPSRSEPEPVEVLEIIPLSRPSLALPDPSRAAPNRPPRPAPPAPPRVRSNAPLGLEALPHDRGARRRVWLMAAIIVPLCALGFWLPTLGRVAPPPDRSTERSHEPVALPAADRSPFEEREPVEKPPPAVRRTSRRVDPATPLPAPVETSPAHGIPEPLDLDELVWFDVSPGSIAPARFGQTFEGSLRELANRAFLKIVGKSSVRSGTLSLRIDGTEVYRRALSVDLEKKKLLKRMFNKDTETFETTIAIAPGEHEIHAVVIFDGNAQGFGSSAILEIDAGATREVKLVAGRKPGRPVLKID